MSTRRFIDVPVRLDRQTAGTINRLAQSCGLTPDQMASAIFAMAFKQQNEAGKKPIRKRAKA